ncbi:MAG: hypothetical protein IPN19_05680 [Elusimicrobia bacterium]|nr:hypothetical protein [Elusimicrobiota bacterium]
MAIFNAFFPSEANSPPTATSTDALSDFSNAQSGIRHPSLSTSKLKRTFPSCFFDDFFLSADFADFVAGSFFSAAAFSAAHNGETDNSAPDNRTIIERRT